MVKPNPEQFIEKIEGIEGNRGATDLSSILQESETRLAPNKEHFDALYAQAPSPETSVSATRKVDVERISLMDEVASVNKQVTSMKIASPDQLVAQVDEAVDKIRSLRAKLEAPNITIKPEFQTSLRNQLSHIDDTLKVTLNKAGLEYKEPEVVVAPKNPIERFLGFLENGQNQLQNLGSEISQFKALPSINPQDMIALQYKVNLVQQQIELFTSLLNKSLESTKTVMNVQV